MTGGAAPERRRLEESLTMTFASTQRSRRSGFTLIEILVVIAIIAVLVSLLAAATMKFLASGPPAQTRAEMVNLVAAIEKFKLEVGVYPPSRLMIREDFAYNANSTDQLEKDSIAFLTKLLERNFGIAQDLNGDGVVTNGAKWILEGDECLVFCLAGPTGHGFKLAGNKVRGPYFTFQAGRANATGRAASGGQFKNYQDPCGNSYAYYSAWTGPNQYNIYTAKYGSDCQSLGVAPYYSGVATNPQYYNPSTYQLISAGYNKLFGPGGAWTPAGAQTIGNNGADDMTNFYPSLMGVPQ